MGRTLLKALFVFFYGETINESAKFQAQLNL